MFVVARLEERNLLESARSIGEEKLELCTGWRVGCLARRRQGSRRVARCKMELVERKQHRLRKIERRIACRRDRDNEMRAIERLVGKSAIFSPEQERDTSLLCKRDEVDRRRL